MTPARIAWGVFFALGVSGSMEPEIPERISQEVERVIAAGDGSAGG